MATPKPLSAVLNELVTDWEKRQGTRPVSAEAEAAWEKAKLEIAAHDEDFRREHPEAA